MLGEGKLQNKTRKWECKLQERTDFKTDKEKKRKKEKGSFDTYVFLFFRFHA